VRNFLGNNLVRWRYLLIPVFLGVVLCFQIIASATDSPQLVVSQFYRWYIQNQFQVRERITEQETAFTPELYQQLVQGFQKQPQSPSGWLDVDPFCDCQVRVFSVAGRSVRQHPDNNLLTEVNIDVYAGLRPPGSPISIKVLVTQQDNHWQIQNLVYTVRRDNLLRILREIN